MWKLGSGVKENNTLRLPASPAENAERPDSETSWNYNCFNSNFIGFYFSQHQFQRTTVGEYLRTN
jgi:hypothetical protein